MTLITAWMSLHITSLSSNCPHKLAYKNNHYNLHGSSVLQNFPVETSMAENLTKLFEFNTSVLNLVYYVNWFDFDLRRMG